jgi:SAM-dependent methyltransferase
VTNSFKDHFSGHASDYARYRPSYPPALFSYLAEICQRRELAWDCATGNGQAARGLAPYFVRVVATDASTEQIARAEPTGGVEYRIATAEASGLPEHSVDLVTVAQALHWFDLSRFYAEVHRVTVPGGVIAVWSYATLAITPEIDLQIDHFYRHTVGEYWPPERRMVEGGYLGMPFPFVPQIAPAFFMEAQWTLDELVGYLGTWSATNRYRTATGADPLPSLRLALTSAWDNPNETKRVRWPLTLRVGSVS